MHRKYDKRMGLLSYIKGNVKGREAHDLEREAMQDPFLADALEGYGDVRDPELSKRLKRMEKSVEQQVTEHNHIPGGTGGVSVFARLSQAENGAGYEMPACALEERTTADNAADYTGKATDCNADGNEERTSGADKSGRRRRKRYAFWISAAAVMLFVCTLSFELGMLSGQKQNLLIAGNNVELIALNDVGALDEGYTEPVSGSGPELINKSRLIAQNNNEQVAEDVFESVAMDQTEAESEVQNKRRQDKASMSSPESASAGSSKAASAGSVQSARYDMIQEEVLEMSEEDAIETAGQPQAAGAILEELHFAAAEPVHKAAARKMSSRNETETAVCSTASPKPAAGYKAYYEYIYSKLELPSEHGTDRLNGIAVLSFNVDEDGQPCDFMIVESSSQQVAEQIIGIIKDGGKWTGSGPITSFTVVY